MATNRTGHNLPREKPREQGLEGEASGTGTSWAPRNGDKQDEEGQRCNRNTKDEGHTFRATKPLGTLLGAEKHFPSDKTARHTTGSGEVLVALENVARVNLIFYVIEASIITVGDDGLALGLELIEVVDDLRAEEGGAVFEGGLVDDDLGTFGLDALHDALDGALAEVIAVALHGKAIDTNGDGLLAAIVLVVSAIGIPAGFAKHLVGNEVLTGAVALDNGCHHVLRHISVVGEQLLGVLGQAITAIAKTGVIIMCTNTGVEAYTGDDGLRVETLDLGIGVEFIEIADTQGEIGVGEELDGFCFGHAHEETRDAFFTLTIDH